MTMEARLLIAFLLMGIVLFGTQYFYKPPPQPAKPVAAQTAAADKSTEAAQTTAAAPRSGTPKAPEAAKPVEAPAHAAAAAKVDIPGAIQADKEETAVVDTDLYHIEFSNRGAVVKTWILKAYKDHNGKPLDLVNQAADKSVPWPFSLSFKNQTAAATDPNSALFRLDKSADNLSLKFEFSDGHEDVKKSFQFANDSYLAEIATEVSQNGVLIPHSIEWRGGFGDQTVVNAANDQHTVFYNLTSSKLIQNDVKTAKNGPASTSGEFSFAGLEDKFFAGVFLPHNKSSVDVTTFSDNVPGAKGNEQLVGAAVGGDGVNSLEFFVGPKDTDLLRKVDPKLQQLIDWGWFELLAKPLFLVLNWVNDHMVHNYGWAIILLTAAINLLLFPLRISSMKSSKKMQTLQPQIAAINAKYKGLSMRDPKKADQNQEIMDLYKREGVNPLGGCLPMVIQLPFFYAFYRVLSVSIELRGAPWLWVHDLSQPETLAIRLLPVLLIVTQFLSQKMTPSPGVDPSQQKMMMLMPLVLGYMFYFASSGLVLYWLTGNLVGIIQQVMLNRSMPKAPATVNVQTTPKKKR